jgi:hypothetical protein
MLAEISLSRTYRIGDGMSLLEKLRIPSDSEDENGEEVAVEFEREFTEEFDDNPHRDPQPGEAPPRKARAAAKAAPRETPRITKKHKDEAQEEVETFLLMLSLTWGWQAPPCGDALEAAAPDIAAKVVKLLARKPQWLLKVREGGLLADALGIALALKPVVTTAWAHYSAPGGGDERGGVEFDPDRFAPYAGGVGN